MLLYFMQILISLKNPPPLPPYFIVFQKMTNFILKTNDTSNGIHMTNVNFVYVHEMLQYKNIITFVWFTKEKIRLIGQLLHVIFKSVSSFVLFTVVPLWMLSVPLLYTCMFLIDVDSFIYHLQ